MSNGYRVTCLRYCFPYQTSRYISGDIAEDRELFGVLAPWIGRDMTQKEADDFICQMIIRHPYIKDSMFIEVCIERPVSEVAVEIYHTICIENDHKLPRNPNVECFATPVRWSD